MSILRDYGVECRNPECNNEIVLGEYMTRRRSEGDLLTSIRFTARKLTCPKCHKTYQYDRSDLREFSTKLSV